MSDLGRQLARITGDLEQGAIRNGGAWWIAPLAMELYALLEEMEMALERTEEET